MYLYLLTYLLGKCRLFQHKMHSVFSVWFKIKSNKSNCLFHAKGWYSKWEYILFLLVEHLRQKKASSFHSLTAQCWTVSRWNREIYPHMYSFISQSVAVSHLWDACERRTVGGFTPMSRCLCRVSIKESSVAKLGSVCRRIYRIFSHAYFHHRQIFDKYEVSLLGSHSGFWW